VAEGGCEIGCGILDCATGAGEFLPAVAIIVVAAGAGILLYMLIAFIVRTIRRRRNRLKPNGAVRPPMPPRGGRRHPGIIARDAATISSLAGEQVAAFGVRLTSKRFLGSSVMLLDGVSSGFTVQLAGGRTVQVPAGRVRVEGPANRGSNLSQQRMEAHLAQIDPTRRNPEAADELDPIPYDHAVELTLKPGDSVEVIGRLEVVPDPTAPAAGYRDVAASVLQPTSGILLRLVPPSG